MLSSSVAVRALLYDMCPILRECYRLQQQYSSHSNPPYLAVSAGSRLQIRITPPLLYWYIIPLQVKLLYVEHTVSQNKISSLSVSTYLRPNRWLVSPVLLYQVRRERRQKTGSQSVAAVVAVVIHCCICFASFIHATSRFCKTEKIVLPRRS